jgi:hypothetical protein
MSIIVDMVFNCDGCGEECIIEHNPTPGEKLSVTLPSGWQQFDDRIYCDECLEKQPAA